MSLAKQRLHLPRFAWVFCLLLMHCILDDRQAGTSTSVTNPAIAKTVSGEVILWNGKPAAGAEISLRLPAIQISNSGIPFCKLVAFTIADDSGRFTVPMVFMKDVYMEIREVGSKLGLPRDSQQVHLRRWPNGLPLDGKMGTFRVEAPGSLTGNVDTVKLLPNTQRWIGVRGTENFAKIPGVTPFLLTGVSTGTRELMVVTVPDTSIWNKDTSQAIVVADSITRANVKARTVTDLGTIFYISD
jgi:hypothetical protein